MGVERIFHASVMPCFDKKLEASRDDFVVDGERDVDCVVGTAEIDGLLTEFGVDLENCPMLSLNLMYAIFSFISRFTKGDGEELSRSGGSGSGGYLAFILRFAALDLFGIKVSEEDIQQGTGNIERIPGRNAGSCNFLTHRFSHMDPT